MGEPSKVLNQFRSQFYTAWTDFKTSLINPALATDYVEKSAGGLGVEDIAALIFDFFKTAATTLQAAAVPIRIFGRKIIHRLLFTLLNPGS